MNSNRRTIKISTEIADYITQRKGKLSFNKYLNEAVKCYTKHQNREQFLEDKIDVLEKEVLSMNEKLEKFIKSIELKNKRKWHWWNILHQLHIC